MKWLLMLLVTTISFSQFKINTTQFQQISLVVDPYASYKENGLNIGIEIENVRTLYQRFSITNFSALNNGYTDLIGAVGMSFTRGMWEKTRWYAGGRLGAIIRNGVHPTAGIECGIDTNLTEGMSIGLRATRDYRSDMEFNDGVNQWRNSGYIRLTFKL
jgi:hypothetical protein